MRRTVTSIRNRRAWQAGDTVACAWQSVYLLDILLDEAHVQGIQWAPSARYDSMLPWTPLLMRIQSAAKLIYISVRADEVEPLLSELSPRGLMLRTGCAIEGQARDLLRKAAKWTRST